jgi:phospholipid/cholesterol/gamma-HCH transport system substrate-binding protein
MPRTRSLAWSELKLGVVGIIAVLLATFFIVAVSGQSGYWWERYGLKARFDDVQGLKSGAVVRVSGTEVGKVTSVDLAGPYVEVAMEISKDVRPIITTDSVASIGSLSLLGEPIVDVRAATTGVPLQDWAYLKSAPAGRSMGDLSETAAQGLDKISALLSDLRDGKGTIGRLVTDEALYRDMQRFVASATAVTNAMNEGKGTIGGLMQDPTAFNSLKAALENLKTSTDRLNSGTGALARLISDDKMGASLSTTTSNVEQITGKLTRGEGTAGKFLTDRQVYDQLNSLTKRVDETILGLSEGRGTAGKLLQDQQLYDNMNKAVTELRDLLAAIRQDPKKYLRVSVSIF